MAARCAPLNMSRPRSLPALPTAPPATETHTTHVLWARRETLPPPSRPTSPSPARGCATPNNSHARADSSVLGSLNRPKIMARAYLASTKSLRRSSTSTTTTTTTRLDDNTTILPSAFPPSPPPPRRYNISRPIGAPFYPKAEDYGGYPHPRLPARLEGQAVFAPYPLEIDGIDQDAAELLDVGQPLGQLARRAARRSTKIGTSRSCRPTIGSQSRKA